MSTPAPDRLPRTHKATTEHLRRAAVRALDDPVALARAARIVRVALSRNVLTLGELTDDEIDIR